MIYEAAAVYTGCALSLYCAHTLHKDQAEHAVILVEKAVDWSARLFITVYFVRS